MRAIVVSRLLFPSNSTSFTNYPLRAHAVRKWRSSPDTPPLRKEGDGLREWRRCRLIFSHRINPAPASRRGLILHGGCRGLLCRGNMQEFYGACYGTPTQRPIFHALLHRSENPKIYPIIIEQCVPIFGLATNRYIYIYIYIIYPSITNYSILPYLRSLAVHPH